MAGVVTKALYCSSRVVQIKTRKGDLRIYVTVASVYKVLCCVYITFIRTLKGHKLNYVVQRRSILFWSYCSFLKVPNIWRFLVALTSLTLT